MKDLKERTIHFIEAEQHYRYKDHIRPDNNFPKGKFYAGLDCVDPDKNLGFEELLIKLSDRLKQNEHDDRCYVTNQVLRIGVARLFWCITFFIYHVKDCYAKFALNLKINEGEWKVVNFNWDILLEKSLSDIQAFWKYSFTPNDVSIPIIKPHGSINWNSFAQKGFSAIIPGFWEPIGTDSTLSYNARDPLVNTDLESQNDDFVYCLYPGDPDDSSNHNDLDLLWQDVRSAIQSAEKIVFIGYSLPDYDSYAKSEIRKSCKNKIIEVYDPSEETLENFCRAFPHAEIKRCSFEDTPFAKVI